MRTEQATQELMEHLFFLHKTLHRDSQKMEADSLTNGVTIPQRIVLGALIRTGSLSLKELSQKIGLSHSTVSGIVDRLERKGFVERFQDPQDRRFTKITVSPEVKDFFQHKLQHLLFTSIVNAFKNATPEEQEKVVEGLSLLRRLMEKEEE